MGLEWLATLSLDTHMKRMAGVNSENALQYHVSIGYNPHLSLRRLSLTWYLRRMKFEVEQELNSYNLLEG